MSTPSQTQQNGTGTQAAAESPLHGLQRRAYDLLIKEAEHALAEGQTDRFKVLMEQIAIQLQAETVASSSDDVVHERQRELRLDRVRLTLAFVLLAGLILIILASVFLNAEAATYVSLVSGLAGIALGWVFGANTVQNVGRASTATTPSTQRRVARRGSAAGTTS